VRFSSVSAAVIGLMVITGSAAYAQAPKAAAPKGKAAPAAAVKAPSGDVAAGATAFNTRCRACHGAAGIGTMIGPDLRGIYGAKAGTTTYAKHSAALKASGLTWNEANLDTWLAGPTKMVPGSTMILAPAPAADVRKNIIAYVATLKK
jgi:cytochrome c